MIWLTEVSEVEKRGETTSEPSEHCPISYVFDAGTLCLCWEVLFDKPPRPLPACPELLSLPTTPGG